MAKLIYQAAIKQASELLAATGMDAENASITASCIVASDVWGIGSHGLMRLPFYLERLAAGGINPKAKLKEITNLPSLRIFDGDSGMGHWQVKKAAEVAANLAQAQGIAAVGVGRSNHCGALGIYVWPMLKQNLVGIIFSNGPAVMPPWGGNKPLLSTSPIIFMTINSAKIRIVITKQGTIYGSIKSTFITNDRKSERKVNPTSSRVKVARGS